MLRLVVAHVSAGIANRSPHAPTHAAGTHSAVADDAGCAYLHPVIPSTYPNGNDRHATLTLHPPIVSPCDRGGNGPCAS